MGVNKTTGQFIASAIIVHGVRYDYSSVEYVNNKSAVVIRCIKHGNFKQRAKTHLDGAGCTLCGIDITTKANSYNTRDFVAAVTKVHGTRYDYSLVDYKRRYQEVEIICRHHGSFQQKPNNHLNGNGCAKCVDRTLDCIYIWKAYDNVYKVGICKYNRVEKRIKEVATKHGYTPTEIKYFKTNNARKIEKWVHSRYPMAIVEKLDGYTEFIQIGAT